MTAKEFFLRVLAPKFPRETYNAQVFKGMDQALHRHAYPNLLKNKSAVIPKTISELAFSNEVILDSLMQSLVDLDLPHLNFLRTSYVPVTNDLTINAFAVHKQSEYSGNIILLPAGMHYYLNFITIPAALLLRIQDPEEPVLLRNSLFAQLELAVLHLHELCSNARLEQEPTKLKPIVTDNIPLETEIAALYLGVLTFLLLHEIGHHALSHTALSPALSAAVSQEFSNARSIVEIRGDQQQEYEADLFALKTLTHLMNVGISRFPINDFPLALGPFLFFYSLSLRHPDIRQPSQTHPSIYNRLRVAFAYYRREWHSISRLWTETTLQRYSQIIGFTKDNAQAFKQLWDDFKRTPDP